MAWTWHGFVGTLRASGSLHGHVVRLDFCALIILMKIVSCQRIAVLKRALLIIYIFYLFALDILYLKFTVG